MGKQKYHSSSWDNLCYPVEEGGLGFRRLVDVSNSLTMKRWWRFRTCKTLWSNFFQAKYCSNSHPVYYNVKPNHSLAWNNLIKIIEKMEELLLWRINSGNSSLWWDNWSELGVIAQIIHLQEPPCNQAVSDVIVNNKWNISNLHLPELLFEQILSIPIGNHNSVDLPVWMPNSCGSFTTSSAWNCIR